MTPDTRTPENHAPAAAMGRAPSEAEEAARREFEAQFVEGARCHGWFAMRRGLGRTIHDLCWPDPSPRRLMRPFGGGGRLQQACEGIADLYRELNEKKPRLRRRGAGSEIERVQLEIPHRLGRLRTLWGKQRRTAPLTVLATELAAALPEGAEPILFGSLACEEPWPQYADVDLGLLLGESVMSQPRLIRQTIRAYRRNLSRLIAIDPVHHHGPFILTPLDWGLYSEAYLPLATLRLATTLKPNKAFKIEATRIDDRLEALRAISRLHEGVRRLFEDPRHLADRYLAKSISSMVLLAPALYCGATGRPIDKRASFDIVKGELDEAAVAALEAVERFRLDWRFTLFPPRLIRWLAGPLAPVLGRNLNRWPDAALARRLEELKPGIELIFQAVRERLGTQKSAPKDTPA